MSKTFLKGVGENQFHKTPIRKDFKSQILGLNFPLQEAILEISLQKKLNLAPLSSIECCEGGAFLLLTTQCFPRSPDARWFDQQWPDGRRRSPTIKPVQEGKIRTKMTPQEPYPIWIHRRRRLLSFVAKAGLEDDGGGGEQEEKASWTCGDKNSIV